MKFAIYPEASAKWTDSARDYRLVSCERRDAQVIYPLVVLRSSKSSSYLDLVGGLDFFLHILGIIIPTD